MSRDFPGSATNRIDVGDNDVSGSTITIHAWVRPDTVAGTDPILAKWASGALEYVFYLNAGKLEATTGNGAGSNDAVITGVTVLTTSVWASVAFRRNGSARNLFINGVSDKSDSGGSLSMAGNAEGTKIGGDGFAANYFDGRIAHVALWSVALSDAEILALGKGASPFLVRPKTMVGYWPLYGVAYPEIEETGLTSQGTQTGTVSAAAENPPVGPLVLS